MSDLPCSLCVYLDFFLFFLDRVADELACLPINLSYAHTRNRAFAARLLVRNNLGGGVGGRAGDWAFSLSYPILSYPILSYLARSFDYSFIYLPWLAGTFLFMDWDWDVRCCDRKKARLRV